MILRSLKGEINVKYQELEIKILKIDKQKMKEKLKKIGASFVEERVQKIYTYDCYDPILMYKLALSDYKITGLKNSLRKIINVISYVKPIFTEEDNKVFKKVFDGLLIDEYITKNIDNIDISKLENKEVLKVITNTKDRFFKWLRLRQDGNKVELTLKYIYSVAAEYKIDEVKEVEIITNDFETTNKLVEEMGYYKRKLVEKRRTSYTYDGMQIEIDEWPLLEPYIEIEGTDTEEIYALAQKLGYKKEQTKVMNTEDVYLEKGINLPDYEVMTFEKQILA